MTHINMDDYKEKLEEEILKIPLDRFELEYKQTMAYIKNEFEDTDFLKTLTKNLMNYNDDYMIKTNYPLLDRNIKIVMNIKPFESMIEKCYRSDVLKEKQMKDWMNPIDCYEVFSDLLRTRISVKYMDGVNYLVDNILKLIEDSEEVTIKKKPQQKAEESGYYAIHMDIVFPIEIQKGIQVKKINAIVEFQINTIVQNLLVDLTHTYYEKNRISIKSPDEKWQWDYRNEVFVPNYLGHIIHYVEGMIMQLREGN